MALPKHMPALDGLRGVAILLVILTHTAQGWSGAEGIFGIPAAQPPTFILPLWLQSIARDAGHGVQLFFVVSAFTLTIRSRTDTAGLAHYALRRLARVAPGYWLAGLAYMILAGSAARFWAPHGVGAGDVLAAAVFLSAWQGGAALAVVPGGWSVCCEISFYVALPVILLATRYRPACVAALAAAGTILALGWSLSGWPKTLFDPILQAPAFLFGVLAAMMATGTADRRAPLLSAALLLAAVAGLPASSIAALDVPALLVFSALCAIVVALEAATPSPWLASAAMRALGRVSYSMYLVHFALLTLSLRVALWLCPQGDWRSLAAHFAVTAALSFAVSTKTYRYIELPAIKWAQRASF
jgi:peptidoglycan/LPS O-acetylase OafA/YrhL